MVHIGDPAGGERVRVGTLSALARKNSEKCNQSALSAMPSLE